MGTNESVSFATNSVLMDDMIRIQNVDDGRVNEALFRIYNQLIKPVRAIEEKYAEMADNKDRINEIKNKSKFTLKNIMVSSVILFVIMFMFAGLVVGEGLDDKMRAEYDTVIAVSANTPDYNKWLMEEHPIIDVIIGRNGVFRSCVCFFVAAVILSIIIWKIIDTICKNKDKAVIDKIEQNNIEIELEAKQLIQSIKQYIVFVPPAYRTSDAIYYFVESYCNNRVDNLKEAVSLYDTYKYRQENLQNQRNTINLLKNIEYNQLVIMSQLDELKWDLELSLN